MTKCICMLIFMFTFMCTFIFMFMFTFKFMPMSMFMLMPMSMFMSISCTGSCTVQVNVLEVDAGAFLCFRTREREAKKRAQKHEEKSV